MSDRTERFTARLLPVRPDGRVLLLRGVAPQAPEAPFWFTVGGEIDPGEQPQDAAVRELAEETGIVVAVDELSAPIEGPVVEFDWGTASFVQHQTFFAVRVPDGEVDFAGHDEGERATISDHGWFTPDELEASGEAADPTLPDVLRQGLAVLGLLQGA